MVICAVLGCSNRTDRDREFSFFRFPAIKASCSSNLKELQKKRKYLWIRRINRRDFTEVQANYARVCSNHFILGKPADLNDINNPDWVPSVKMGYKKMEIEACPPENKTEKIVIDDNGGGIKRGFQRKRLLLDGEIRINTSKNKSSPSKTRVLAESVPIKCFQGSECFSEKNSCTADTPVMRWTCSKIINSETNENSLSKRNIDVNFTYQNLLKNLQLIEKPNDFWSINPIPNAIICARWSKNYACEKKLVIDNALTVRVFLKENWEINLSELMNITCLDDISNLLEKIENYKIIQFQDLKKPV